MRHITLIFLAALLFVILVVATLFAADTVPATAAPSLLAWMTANTAAIFGIALAISEFLSLIPAFKGNGILDTIIKALILLSGKEKTTAPGSS